MSPRPARTPNNSRRSEIDRKNTIGPKPPLLLTTQEEVLDLRPVEGGVADAELAHLARALGNPARVKILRVLIRRGTCVCGALVDEVPLAQSTVSQHLKVLKLAGLIQGTIAGPNVCYCVDPRVLRRLKALIGAL